MARSWKILNREVLSTGYKVLKGHWKADTTASLSGRFSLHHVFDNPDAGIDQIGIRVKNLHPSQGITRWSFLVRYGYDPSSLNNWSVFLMSDNGPGSMSPDGGQNGFAIGVNLTGSDDTLRLWKVKGNADYYSNKLPDKLADRYRDQRCGENNC